jgi:hypothetical protein
MFQGSDNDKTLVPLANMQSSLSAHAANGHMNTINRPSHSRRLWSNLSATLEIDLKAIVTLCALAPSKCLKLARVETSET